jgi:hypothetical protein
MQFSRGFFFWEWIHNGSLYPPSELNLSGHPTFWPIGNATGPDRPIGRLRTRTLKSLLGRPLVSSIMRRVPTICKVLYESEWKPGKRELHHRV